MRWRGCATSSETRCWCARPGAWCPPRAERLAPRLRDALGALEGVFEDEAGFDPGAARQVFKISSADLAQFVLLPPLLKQLAREAPGLRLVLRPPRPPRPELFDALASGALDLAFGIFDEAPEGFRCQAVFREEFLCMLRKGHPAAAAPLELERWLSLQHLSVAPRGGPGSIVDDALAKLGKQRDIVLVVPHFLMAPLIVAETDLAVLLPARIARRYAELLPVELLPPPLPLEAFTITQLWHERSQGDAAHGWLRQQVARAGRAEPEDGGRSVLARRHGLDLHVQPRGEPGRIEVRQRDVTQAQRAARAPSLPASVRPPWNWSWRPGAAPRRRPVSAPSPKAAPAPRPHCTGPECMS
jgi:DNA-binding transcriptional LysR family regulator